MAVSDGMLRSESVKTLSAVCFAGNARSAGDERVAVEEPLEIRVVTESDGLHTVFPVSVTMRTPGQDHELALGFLFTEDVIRERGWVVRVAHEQPEDQGCNTVQVFLRSGVSFDAEKLTRHVFTSSSCGICGKVTIDNLRARVAHQPVGAGTVERTVLAGLPEQLLAAQAVFRETGGLHGCALFEMSGRLIAVKEDVGRHNALDKLIGGLFLAERLPASDTVLLLSGRISFELVQKAMLAGIPMVAGVGAPSSLAVELADSAGMTLVGFLRGNRFNAYSGHARIV